MGLAMRVARYFPTVVIGAASLASQVCMPQSCSAWNSIPASALEQSYDLEGSNVISDSAVQPAAYYDSRPRSNSSAQYSQYPQNMRTADDNDVACSAAGLTAPSVDNLNAVLAAQARAEMQVA